MSVRVIGMDELRRKLASLPDAVAENALLQAVTLAAKPVLDRAEESYPRRVRGNKVRKKVDMQTEESSRRTAVVAVGPTKAGGLGGFFQEIGTRHHPARPWLRPAFDAEEAQVQTTIRRELKQRIELAAAHG